jgi:pilus assembly protein CpaB
MSLRAIATLVIAVVLGLAAVLIVNSLINNAQKPAAQQAAGGPSSPVVVAAKPIGRGVVVTPDLLKVVNFPAGASPEGAFTAVNQLTGAGKDVQRVALRDLAPGEPVLATRISAPGAHINLSDVLDPGMQAVTLRTNDVAGVAGFILPGDHVDILLTRTAQPTAAAAPQTLVQALMENVKVVGIDQTYDTELNHPAVVKAITVEVTPQQAQTITLAQTVGAVSFSLRHVQDSARLTRIATTVAALGFGPPAPKIRPREPVGLVRVTRSTETTVYQLSAR